MRKTVALLNCHGDDVFCFRKEIIESLENKGYRILLSCPESHRLDVFRNNNNIIIEDVDIDRRGTNPIKDIKLLFHYVWLFRKYRPDIVCTFTIKPNIYGSIAADILKIPHINNITGLGSGFQNGGFVQRIVKLLYKLALGKSKKVFFQNAENEKVALESCLLPKNVSYQCIPGSGVNLSRFHNENSMMNVTDSVVFNYIGRILKDKRIDDYLEAARIIKRKYSNVIFNVIGFVESTEIHYLKLLGDMERLGIIHYYGSVDDVRSFIRVSDAIIHPSSYGEGISNVLLETAASGKSIITTDVAGCKDCVDNGISGFVYPAENVKELVTRIEQFIMLSPIERWQMGQLGRKKMEREFDRNIVVNAYLREIE
ncbi:glycosyltransferase family 4 protein [Butyricimonas paravirosa]